MQNFLPALQLKHLEIPSVLTVFVNHLEFFTMKNLLQVLKNIKILLEWFNIANLIKYCNTSIQE